MRRKKEQHGGFAKKVRIKLNERIKLCKTKCVGEKIRMMNMRSAGSGMGGHIWMFVFEWRLMAGGRAFSRRVTHICMRMWVFAMRTVNVENSIIGLKKVLRKWMKVRDTLRAISLYFSIFLRTCVCKYVLMCMYLIYVKMYVDFCLFLNEQLGCVAVLQIANFGNI